MNNFARQWQKIIHIMFEEGKKTGKFLEFLARGLKALKIIQMGFNLLRKRFRT